jgi:hypothetical protein
MDSIGFGLENYDAQGRYRAAEPTGTNPCPIDGSGTVAGVGTFNGPGELGDMLLKGGMNHCVVQELYEFAIGRTVLDATDARAIDFVTNALGGATADFRFSDLLLQFVSADAFRQRREE